MAEDLAQHDSGDEWLVELLSLPSSSLTRRQIATAVSSAGEAASALGSAAHAAAGSSAGALPAAVSVEDHCIAARELMQRHTDTDPCAPWPPRCPRQCSVCKSRQCDLPWDHEEACCCGCSVPDDSTLGPIRYQRAEERPSTSSSKAGPHSGGARGHVQGTLAIQGKLGRRVCPGDGDVPRPGGGHDRPGRRAPAPPSILAIRAERLQKEKRVNQ